MKKIDLKDTKTRLLIEAGIILFFLIWWAWSWFPVTERYTLDVDRIDEGSVRILLLTDLHSCYYGPGQKRLLGMINRENPDIVILGGDFFDDKLGYANAKTVAEDLVSKYPCYYVTGNHEYWTEQVDELKTYMRSIGVHVLEGDCETVEINGITLDICGVDDPTRLTSSQWKEELDNAWNETSEEHFKILASHRPEPVNTYASYGFDLILAGHAHGGQILIPFINKGVCAPNQSFFCEYVNGLYKLSNGSRMIVSRGLGRESTFLPRYFNHPELITIDIK